MTLRLCRTLALALAPVFCLTLAPTFASAQVWPRQIDSAGHVLHLEAAPRRIASTSPSLTGILLALEAPLTATAGAMKGPLADDQGFFLQWAEIAHQRGVAQLYPNLAFDMESLILAEPDLVVASAAGGDNLAGQLPNMEAMGFKVLLVDYSTQSWQDQARIIGKALGLEAKAEDILSGFDHRAGEVRDKIRAPEGKASIVSYNFAGSYAVSKTISAQAQLLAELGFTIAPLPPEMTASVTRSADFDFISLENLAPAIAGETVFLLNGTQDSVAAFLADPLLAHLPAVQKRQVYALGPTSFRVDYYSGLQIIDLIEQTFATP